MKRRPPLNEQIRAARESAGLTQVAMAAALGTSQRFVSALERGEKRPSLERLIDIARETGQAFEIDGRTILPDKPG